MYQSALEVCKSMAQGVQFEVMTLKVLATRKVIKERMDYKDYLGGMVKEEMDWLERLQGTFLVDRTEVEVTRLWETLETKKVRKHWNFLRKKLPTEVLTFLEGKKEFSISETGKSEKREWDLQDVDGSSKRFQLSNSMRVAEDNGGWKYQEELIKDGILIKWYDKYDSKGREMICELDSFHIDKEKRIQRVIRWKLPFLNVKIAQWMWCIREDVP